MKIADGPVTLELNRGGERGGYIRWRDYHKSYPNNQAVCYVHQLCAIADGADPYKVFSDGAWQTHHSEIEHPWCNWRENVEVRDERWHCDHHMNGGGGDTDPNIRTIDNTIHGIVSELEDGYERGVPVEKITLEAKKEKGMDPERVFESIEELKMEGMVYEPAQSRLLSV